MRYLRIPPPRSTTSGGTALRLWSRPDGLALGKGVTVAMTEEEAVAAVRDAIDGMPFGGAGARVVIEEYLTGPEVSVLAFVDGKHLKTMPSAQDHKRAYDGDAGPNTGGMGAFSPSRFYTDYCRAVCMETIFQPTVAAMAEGRAAVQGRAVFRPDADAQGAEGDRV